MTRLYSYVVVSDHGFAPNPFHGYCTLANCKPRIRWRAQPGGWILGSASRAGRGHQCRFSQAWISARKVLATATASPRRLCVNLFAGCGVSKSAAF